MMLNTEGFSASGLERKATCKSLFQKMQVSRRGANGGSGAVRLLGGCCSCGLGLQRLKISPDKMNRDASTDLTVR
jgi:hypothetical protein